MPRNSASLPIVRRLGVKAQVEVSDARLVERAQDGESWAVEALYRRHAPVVLRTALRILACKSDAEDVTHDAFATVLERLDDLRDAGAFRSWLLKSAVRAARWKLRRRGFGRALGLEPGPVDASFDQLASVEAAPEVRVALAEVSAQLDRLRTGHRIAWVLRVVEGHPLADIAEYLGVSLATTKRWVAKSERRLAAHFEDLPSPQREEML